MKVVKISLTAGFAIFSMFFGSGNLVFPIKLGVENPETILPSTIGLIITGVIVPFIGLYGIILYKGYSGKYFNYIGDKFAKFLIFLMLALLGPFGVIPRCITVAFGGMKLVFPDISEYVFGVFFCLTIYYMLVNRVGLIQILGKFLSPLLVIGLMIIIIAGLFDSPSIVDNIKPFTQLDSFAIGILTGYHTMDLLAAFFFGVSISIYLDKKKKIYNLNKKEVLHISILSSLVGGLLLITVYTGFIYLGGKYSFDLVEVPPERLMVYLADITLGGIARPVSAVTIFVACFTTAIVLSQIFCSYVEENIIKKRTKIALQGSILVSFIISLLGFATISIYLASILNILYPALISIAVLNLITKTNLIFKRTIFYLVVFANIAFLFI
jgi:LIVCS family branched-chain amino acid:cation transporter